MGMPSLCSAPRVTELPCALRAEHRHAHRLESVNVLGKQGDPAPGLLVAVFEALLAYQSIGREAHERHSRFASKAATPANVQK